MSDKFLLFVYGTLKKMGPNHHLIQSAKYLGVCHTEPEYRLYNYCGLPCLIMILPSNTRLRGRSIRGELYEVDNSLTPFLDKFEGSCYCKRAIRIKEHPEKTVTAYFYSRYLPIDDRESCQDCGSEFTLEEMERV